MDPQETIKEADAQLHAMLDRDAHATVLLNQACENITWAFNHEVDHLATMTAYRWEKQLGRELEEPERVLLVECCRSLLRKKLAE